MTSVKALLFDIGEVVTREQWGLLDLVERDAGRTLVGRGPLDPSGDPVWQRYLVGELSYLGYWAEYATSNGYDDWRELFRALPFDEPRDDFVHPEAARLIAEAQAAGLKIGALTNDGVGINGMSFFESVPILAGFDVFADAQEFGGKPAPAAYLNAAAMLGLDPAEIVFLDDTPYCVDGARAVGMHGVLIDPMDRRIGFDETRRLAGLGDVGEAQRFVELVADTYRGDDLDAMAKLFDPDVSVHLDGRQVAVGLEATRRHLADGLGVGSGSASTVRLRLRSASYDTIVAEQTHTTPEPDGAVVRHHTAEIFTLRRGRVIHWHRYGQR